MAEIRGCATCKHIRLDADEEPCVKCRCSGTPDATEDCYEPMQKPTNGDWVRTLNNEQMAEFFAGLMGNKILVPVLEKWLDAERKDADG